MTNDLNRRNVNYYDAVFAGDPTRIIEKMPHEQTLFGDANIGNQAFTNIHVPFTDNPRTSSLAIMNIYARSTLPPDAPGFEQFLNWTVVNVHVGPYPLASWSMADLLRRSEGYCMGDFRSRLNSPLMGAEHERIAIRGTASRMYDRIENPIAEYTLYKDGANPETQKYWENVAKIAHDELLHEGRPIYIAPRQHMRLTVTSYKPGIDALKRMLAAYPSGADASHWPGLWVHLEGRETHEPTAKANVPSREVP